MDYNQMIDSQLAGKMVNYIGRIDNVQSIIGRYLDEMIVFQLCR